ncbi:hypothetical protein L6452_12707 [Arctium lappa]|uniref:Uncharacterized protein n=1 Tax=Arctium lappa TaxID=4217 RepID=A0ACB9DR02_ARCLA|nr:hypothetical protein L6452_12707 [Arctium lappa]
MRKLLSAIPTRNGRDNFLQHDQINGDTSPILVVDTAFDLATIPVIGVLLLLSLISLSFIFHLRLRSRGACRLREFNNLWTIRVLLVFFISHWAINEIIRLPFFRRRYFFPFLPTLTLWQQDDLCKLHVVFSLGFTEPGFLIALFFLISESIKKQNRSEMRTFLWVLLMCLPTFILQTIVVFSIPQLPSMMTRSSFLSVDDGGNKSMTCTYPLLSSMVFGAFGVVYSVGLLISCWRVCSLVINKKMKLRIKVLGWTVMMSLLVESLLLLGVVGFGKPESMWYGGALLGMFVSVAVCGGVAEIVLVIKPIVEALVVAGDNNCQWNPVLRYLHPVEDRIT